MHKGKFTLTIHLTITRDNFGPRTKFEEHMNKICSIVNKKQNDLHRIARHTTLNKRKMVLSAFLQSQFSYCHLIWMFHSITRNNKINQ